MSNLPTEPANAEGGNQIMVDLGEPLLSQEEGDNDALHRSEPRVDDARRDVVFNLGRWGTFRMNHNVFLNLVLSVLCGMSDSLWAGTVFAAYLKRLGHNENSAVGNVEAVNGLAALLSALPVGYLADKYGRDKLCRAGGFLFMFTAILHAGTMQWIGNDDGNLTDSCRRLSLILLGIVMALWGVGRGIVSGPCQALYADSTPAGERSRYYHYLFVTYVLSSCLGPIVAIALFQKLGDEWDFHTLERIIYVGLGLEVINAILLLLFDDKKALDEDEEETTIQTVNNDPAQRGDSCLLPDTTSTESVAKDGSNGVSENLLDDEAQDLADPLLGEQSGTDEEPSASAAAVGRRWMIPYILFLGSLIFSIGSGMTVKFFPLFFKDEVGMSPTQVQVIYLLVPIGMCLLSGVGMVLSSFLGRVQTTMLLQGLGVACLYSMVFMRKYLDSHPFVLVPVYIMRTALMNSSYPLVESILMDFVPKSERARWKSLESVSEFGWCGSAAIGGYVSDRWDYSHTFFLTATVQTIGTFTNLGLLPLVPRKEQDLATTGQETGDTNNDGADGRAADPGSP